MRDIADLKGGLTKGQKRRPGELLRSVPYLRVANVQRGYLDLATVHCVEAREEEIDELRLQPGDVLFNEGGDRDKLGRGWLWNGEIAECIHQNHVFRARLRSSGIEPKFVSWYANFVGQSYFVDQGKQTTNLASLNLTKLGEFPVLLAPHAEQRRIVLRIEELLTKLDAAVAALERVRANLKRYRAAVLKAAVEGKLTEDWRAAHPDVEPASELLKRVPEERRRKWEETELARYAQAGKTPPRNWQSKYKVAIEPDTEHLPELPESWYWSTLDQLICHMRNGLSQKPYDSPPGHPILRINAVRPMRVDLSEIRYLRPSPDDLHGYILDNGDLLFTRYNGSLELLGVAGMVSGILEPVLHPDKIIRIKTALAAPLTSYLEIACNTGISRAHVERRARTTAGQTGISGADLRSVPIPLPPTSEQREIVTQVASCLSIVTQLESQIEGSHRRADALRQSILKHAFEGKLVPQNPAEEPASMMLERIRATREPIDRKDGGRRAARRERPDNRQPSLFDAQGFIHEASS